VRRCTILLLAGLACACPQHASEPSQIEPSTTTPMSTSAAPLPLSSPPQRELAAWRWIYFGETEHEFARGFAGMGPLAVDTIAGPCSVVARGEHESLQLCCTPHELPRWCAALEHDFVPGASLASHGELVFVADYPAIASGARIAAYRVATGSLAWTREAAAIGPQDHSEYENRVQLRIVDARLIAYGREAHGSYVEVMDPHSGALLDHALVEPPQLEWRWHDAPEPSGEVELALPEGGVCRYLAEASDRHATLECSGSTPWQLALDAEFVGRGALALSDAQVLLVSWSRIASGARARAFERTSGRLLWDLALEGIGPQEHSKYSNLVQIHVERGQLLVFGDEAHGRYAEARALESGALRCSLRWP
jgi:hypothetical protein